jgi:cysteinyl-tRNA synthetase
MKIHNTLTRKKEEFLPADKNHIRMYVCGPTVYNLIHIGNARVYVFFDTVRRYFESRGYKVTYVSNFTDIDDKIIKRAQEEKVSFEEVARRYEEEFKRDIAELGLKHADITPRATEHIQEMIDTINILLSKGIAYESGGDVYFSVSAFPGYGKLSGRSLEEMRAGERVEPGPNKRDPLDFALWKAAKPGEPSWDSPFGKGRPGWHIECSVMSEKYLGFGFEIHGGGQDLIFPHHENEIAQAEAASGSEPFVKYWMHNGLLTVSSEKMAKSSGNIILLRDALKVYGADVLKLFYLSTHYRSPLDYSPERLQEIKKSLQRIADFVERVEQTRIGPEVDKEEILRITARMKESFFESMEDDFNTARAVASVFEFIREVNGVLDRTGTLSPELKESILKELNSVLDVFGIDLSRFVEFQSRKIESHLDEIYLKLKGVASFYGIFSDDIEELIEKLIELRAEARREKDFSKADDIRNKLLSAGVKLEDTPEGTRYRLEG